jgi:hypothetical protein
MANSIGPTIRFLKKPTDKLSQLVDGTIVPLTSWLFDFIEL